MLEDDVFKKRKLDKDKLITYGFVKEKNTYKYSKLIMDNSFRVDITIDSKSKVIGKVYDLDGDYEYTNFRLENVKGDFVNRVKEEFLKVLEDIADNCFTKEYFIYQQSNEVSNLIKEKYNVLPEFLWEDSPNFGVFRNENSNKWFGLIMNIDKSKLNSKENGEVEVINVKLDDLLDTYLKNDGIYPAYHMSKKSWVSIILDGTLSNEDVMSLIDISYELSNRKKEWLVPANPKYYDIVNAFNETDTIIWKQSNNIAVGDTIYLYIAEPYSCIMFKCSVTRVNIPYPYADKNVSMKKVMKIKLLKRYNDDEFTFKKLNDYGVRAIRGPRSVPSKLSEDLNKS